jgi:chemotaxis protein methyltransferase WspC
VFCRNVLIYFDQATQARVIQELERMLAPEGLICMGPAEPFLLHRAPFLPSGHPFAFAYRKMAARSKGGIVEVQSRARKTASRAGSRSTRLPVPPRRMKSSIAQAQATVAVKTLDLQAATRLADAGRLAEAARACEAHLQQSGPSADAFYLLGLVRDSMGLERPAADCYRKAIYLDPAHLEALTHLALLAQKQGDIAFARRLQNRARRIQEGAKR